MNRKERIVVASNLSKVFSTKVQGEIKALDAVNIELVKGQLTALIGPDGAGKTTFMRLISGLMRKTVGDLTVLGLDVETNPQAVQNQLSYMPQRFGLYEDLSVAENMTLYADLHGVPAEVRAQRFPHLLDIMGLSAFTERLSGKLSGGMKQKLGLACTLVRSPELLLLDEPTVGVDPLSRRELWSILKQLVNEEKLSVLVSTAYMDEAALCDFVYILNKGKVLAHDTPNNLKAYADGHCFEVEPPKDVLTRVLQCNLLEDKGIIDAVPSHGVVRFIVDEKTKALVQIPWLQELGAHIYPVESTLEDSFMMLLRKDERQIEEGYLSDTIGEKAKKFTSNPISKLPLIAKPSSDEVDIVVHNLVKKFGDFTAVANTSFEVHRGEVFGLLGPNGAGKTTTFRMLCGLLPSTSGDLSVANVDLRVARNEARNNIGYVAQKFSLYGNFTVYENLRFFGGVYGLAGTELKTRIQTMLEEFDLLSKVNEVADNLSTGYKQRLSMAVGLIHSPKILFLDEPTSGIDPIARRSFWQRITRLSAEGTTIIITTHFMEEAEYCDRFIIQDMGKLLILGAPNDVRQKMQLPHANMNDIFIKIVEENRKECEA